MRIAITGANGMLGKAIQRAAEARGHEAVPFERGRWDVTQFEQAEYWVRTVQPDAVINCAGIVPARLAEVQEVEMVETNALAPFYIATACRMHNAHFVQVSTDCVFDGARDLDRAWIPQDVPNAVDLYGRTKALGELIGGDATVVRTSFIGPEHGLWRWYMDHDGPVEGWYNASWNGSTVDAVADGLVSIAEEAPGGVQHLATDVPISKGYVLELLQFALVGPTIQLMRTPAINRWLAPTYVLPMLDLASVRATAMAEISRLAARHG